MDRSPLRIDWLLAALLLGGVALGQGQQSNALARELREKGVAGPGFVQESFLGGLKTRLEERFGEKRGGSMFDGFVRRGARMKRDDVRRLLNGQATKSQMRAWFGKRNLSGVRAVVDGVVLDKDMRLFFGILLFEMIDGFGLDPSAEFCRQVNHARDEMTEKDFRRILVGGITENLVERAFGFTDGEDQKFMKKILRSTRGSRYFTHPLCDSMPIGSTRGFEPRRFPAIRKGKGKKEQGYEDGLAGGLPFDNALPFVPFYGRNIEQIYEQIHEAAAKAAK